MPNHAARPKRLSRHKLEAKLRELTVKLEARDIQKSLDRKANADLNRRLSELKDAVAFDICKMGRIHISARQSEQRTYCIQMQFSERIFHNSKSFELAIREIYDRIFQQFKKAMAENVHLKVILENHPDNRGLDAGSCLERIRPYSAEKIQ